MALLRELIAGPPAAPRDRFIGWTPELCEKNLPRVVDNPRFLILPWIKIPNLGSHILAIVRRQLPVDWTARYSTTPVLIETFVETRRYTGAVYSRRGNCAVVPVSDGAFVCPTHRPTPQYDA